MTITHELKIDLVRPAILPPVAVVQGDTYTREVQISLYAAGVAWELPEGHDVAIRYSKPDGTAGIYDTLPDNTPAWSSEGNTVTVMLCPQMLTCPGEVPAQVCVIVGSRLISTFAFVVDVEEDPSKGALTSENYHNWRYAFLPQTAEAKVGQYLMIAEVDEKGRVVAFEAVDAPSGGNCSDSGGNANYTDVSNIKTVLGNIMTIIKAQTDSEGGVERPQGYNMDVSSLVVQNDALIAALGGSGGGDTPDEPETEKTLTSISATYSGGSVTAGTAVSALTGIVVTAHYSDGTSEVVTGYTLSGTIAEGNNTITVTYQGKTTTFTVTGVVESGGEETDGNDPPFDTLAWTDGLRIISTGAEYDNQAQYSTSDYADVTGKSSITFTLRDNVPSGNVKYTVVSYAADKETALDNESIDNYLNASSTSYPKSVTISIPNGAVYLRICGTKLVVDNVETHFHGLVRINLA